MKYTSKIQNLGGHNLQTIALSFYYNHFLERATSELQAQISTSAHLLSFQTSSSQLKPLKTKCEVFIPKLCNKFIDTYNMALKIC